MDTIHYSHADYDQFTIAGLPYLVGNPNIQPIAFGTLNPGDKVVKIGRPGRNGKTTSANRIDTWMPWVQYMGFVFIDRIDEKPGVQKCLAFKLPPDGMFNRASGLRDDRDFFAIYLVMEQDNMLVRPNFARQTVRTFHPIMTLFQQPAI